MSAQQKLPQFIHGQPSMGLPFEKELVVDLFAGGGGVCAQAKSPGEHPQREGCDGRGGQWRWVWAARAQVWRGQMISPWWSPRWGIRPATA